jgi:hypothetical protein
MSAERTYEGESQNGNLQEALASALQLLKGDLGEDGVRDASASWAITEISGECGGIRGICSVKAKITANRVPGWQK